MILRQFDFGFRIRVSNGERTGTSGRGPVLAGAIPTRDTGASTAGAFAVSLREAAGAGGRRNILKGSRMKPYTRHLALDGLRRCFRQCRGVLARTRGGDP